MSVQTASGGKSSGIKDKSSRGKTPSGVKGSPLKLLDVCESLVALARSAGAASAEAFAERTRESSAKVRDGEVEELQQATSKGVGLRVISQGRSCCS